MGEQLNYVVHDLDTGADLLSVPTIGQAEDYVYELVGEYGIRTLNDIKVVCSTGESWTGITLYQLLIRRLRLGGWTI